MTLQLQQAIKLLQLSRLELENLVQQELTENPALEEAQEAPEEIAEPPAAPAAEALDPEPIPASAEDIDFEKVLEQYEEFRAPPAPALTNTEDLPSLENRATPGDSLFDHLLWQVQMSSLGFEERLVATELIGALDDNGYLREDGIQSACDAVGVDAAFAERVLARVQAFDPPGVGARDLRECLLIQARLFLPDDALVLDVIEHHLDELVGRSSLTLQKTLGISDQELRRVLNTIATLDPKPGRGYSSASPEYEIPDIYVEKRGGEWVVTLNENGLPRLRVSDYYRRVLHQDRNADTRDFLRGKVRAAVWFVRSIYQRQSTIQKVAESIFRFQRDFLERGPKYLRPLVLRDVAQEVGMHESTISRVTTKKYAQTPQGVFELKYFFGARIESSAGDDLSAQAVRERIRTLIAGEDPRSPLSDQAIVAVLAKEDLKIARRTVAKYRQQLGLLSSSERIRVL
ncbi:MAG: RNA polymerase factor sigma-54 [Deltaproteobacteria bacterium]|nr:RNA polymerase factor sigma-54 [Deltaproteobacteria bacterium]